MLRWRGRTDRRLPTCCGANVRRAFCGGWDIHADAPERPDFGTCGTPGTCGTFDPFRAPGPGRARLRPAADGPGNGCPRAGPAPDAAGSLAAVTAPRERAQGTGGRVGSRLCFRGQVVTRFCKKCSTEKPLDAFHNDARRRDGLSEKCQACHDAIRQEQKTRANREHYKRYGTGRYAVTRAEWHTKNPHKKFEYHKKKYETIEGRARHLWTSAKKRIPVGFSITKEWIASEIKKGFCCVTGMPFDLAVNKNGKHERSWAPFAPSLNKIDPNKGYTQENTRVVIWQYNLMKGQMSDEQLVELCRVVVARAA